MLARLPWNALAPLILAEAGGLPGPPARAAQRGFLEVADTSLRFDRGRKAKLYAGYGIPDYWIVNLPKNLLEVRRDPGPDGYGSTVTLRRGDRVSLAAFPDLTIDVSELLPLP